MKEKPITESLLSMASQSSSGWHLGACHYRFSKISVRCTDNGRFWAITNNNSFDVIGEIKTVQDLWRYIIIPKPSLWQKIKNLFK